MNHPDHCALSDPSEARGRRPVTVVYVDVLEVGHAADHLAFYIEVCRQAGLDMAAFVTPALWQRGCNLVVDQYHGAQRVGGPATQDFSAAGVRRLLDDVVAYCKGRLDVFIYFPWLDPFLDELVRRRGFGLVGAALPVPFAGVFFRDDFNYWRQIAFRPRRLFKALARLARLRLTSGGTCREIVTFNPEWRAKLSARVTMLPDALSALDRSVEPAELAALSPPANADRTRFLVFGDLGPRKGILQAIEGFKRLSDEALARSQLRVLGKFPDPSYRDAVLSGLEQLQGRGLKIEIKNERQSDAELHSALLDCHFLVATYIDHFGSSHVLGLSARYGRPVIGQHTSQMAAEIQRFGLGVTVNPRNPDDVARGLRDLLSGGDMAGEGMRHYLSNRSPDRARDIASQIFLRLADAVQA